MMRLFEYDGLKVLMTGRLLNKDKYDVSRICVKQTTI